MVAAWRAQTDFVTDSRRIKPETVLADADGAEIVDTDGRAIGGIILVPVKRTEVTGPKSFDTLSLAELIEMNYDDLTTVIADGASISSVVTLRRRPILTILVPSGWDDAVLTFQVSQDGVTYYELVDEAGEYVSLTVDAGRMLRVTNLDQWAGFQYLKVRSGTSSVPVAQTGTATITLTVRDE
jgi:hypothetical protein